MQISIIFIALYLVYVVVVIVQDIYLNKKVLESEDLWGQRDFEVGASIVSVRSSYTSKNDE